MSSKKRDLRAVGVHFDGDLRRALIDAAAATLDEVGAEGLSLREVARRVGVSHAAPAHHFGDRAGLLTVVATEGFELFMIHMAGALATDPAELVAQLPAIGRAYAEFAERHPGHFGVMFRPALLHASDPDYLAASTAAFEAMHQHIARCQQAGWHPEANTLALASASWSLAHGIAVLRSQGSLGLHYPDADALTGVEAIVATLTEG